MPIVCEKCGKLLNFEKTEVKVLQTFETSCILEVTFKLICETCGSIYTVPLTKAVNLTDLIKVLHIFK